MEKKNENQVSEKNNRRNNATIRIYYFVDFAHTPTFTLLLHASIAAPCVTLCESEVVVKHEQRALIIFYSNRISCHRLLCIQCAMFGVTRMLGMDFPKKISREWARCALSCIWISLYICKKHIHRECEEKPEAKKRIFWTIFQVRLPALESENIWWHKIYDYKRASSQRLHHYIINVRQLAVCLRNEITVRCDCHRRCLHKII